MPERRHLAELPETGAVETIEDARGRTLGAPLDNSTISKCWQRNWLRM